MAKYTPAQLANMKKNGYTKEEMEELAKYDEMIDKELDRIYGNNKNLSDIYD